MYLEKYPKIKGIFYLCPKQVRYFMVLTQNQVWGNSSCCPKACWVIHLCYSRTWTMAI